MCRWWGCWVVRGCDGDACVWVCVSYVHIHVCVYPIQPIYACLNTPNTLTCSQQTAATVQYIPHTHPLHPMYTPTTPHVHTHYTQYTPCTHPIHPMYTPTTPHIHTHYIPYTHPQYTQVERTTNHDVKAVEYVLKEAFKTNKQLEQVRV